MKKRPEPKLRAKIDIPRYHLNSRNYGHSDAITGVPDLPYWLRANCSRATIRQTTYTLSPHTCSLKYGRRRNLPVNAFTVVNYHIFVKMSTGKSKIIAKP